MRYKVIVEDYNPLIEEEIDIRINSTRLKCFMPYGMDFSAEDGKSYYAEIESIVLDKLIMNEIHEPMKQIQSILNSFAHRICGYLDIDKGLVQSSIDVYIDMAYLYDYGYLDGKFVELVIDRFNIEFV